MQIIRYIVGAIAIGAISSLSVGQTTSRGPGKGPPRPGEGKSKYTYPQPPKVTPVPLSAMLPSNEIPERPERFIWKLTSNVNGHPPDKPSNEVPVYAFDRSGARILVGAANIGEEIKLDEVRAFSKRHFYKFPWPGQVAQGKERFGRDPEFWVDGANIEFSGTR